MAEKKAVPAPWSLTQEQLDSITDHEVRTGTARLLPPVAEIPKEFWAGNVYTRIVESLYIGEQPAHSEVEWLPGFNGPEAITRMCFSHIREIGPEYDHKIAGVGYMISKLMRVTPILVP